jgi:hypothetical protein
MERIVIEVDNTLARAWREASEQTKKIIGNKINISLARELITKPQNGYVDFLIKLRAEMKQKGLTQEELDEILNEE